MKTLYICYFGLREPLVQTQVVPYLRELARAGFGVSLLTFEPDLRRIWSRSELDAERDRLRGEGINWHARAYHKRPSAPATIFDIIAGALAAARIARRESADVLHARAHVPLAMALLAQRLTRRRLVFDVRGLMADEYADAGVWREGSPVFRAVKRLERAGLRRADQIVVLTRRMREWVSGEGLARAERIEVVPCCVDFARFDDTAARNNDDATARDDNDDARSEVETGARFEVVYAGAATGLYLIEEMARFFIALRALKPGAFLRVLTRTDAREVAGVLARVGLREGDFWIGAVSPSDVPRYLRRARLGLSFRKASFSQIAASPTKIPEYLAAGLPVVSNAGVGDTDELLARARVGVVVEGFDEESLARAAASAVALADNPTVRARCVAVARGEFDLSAVGGVGYRNVYRRLAEGSAR